MHPACARTTQATPFTRLCPAIKVVLLNAGMAAAAAETLQTTAHHHKGKVLVGMSSADYIRTSDNKEHATGFFLRELGRPLIKLLEAGYDVEVGAQGKPAAGCKGKQTIEALHCRTLQGHCLVTSARTKKVWALDEHTPACLT